MQLVRGIHNIKRSADTADVGCVLTIGNFDGVHLGHHQVINTLVKKAHTLKCDAVVVVFEPQPQEFFSPKTAPARLCRLRDKYRYLKKLGVDRLVCIRFNQAFSSQSAEQFIQKLLVKQLSVKHLIVGDDFRFGKDRLGNFAMLSDSGAKLGFTVSDTSSYKIAGCRISSTEIRKALSEDRLTDVEHMLGRAYSISGRVFHGDKRGRQLGFPTANVSLKRKKSPVNGVYAVKVHTPLGEFNGVANIGNRPTVAGINQQLEVHIFDFTENLYGKNIDVVLFKKLRGEMKFSSIIQLTEQIKTDCVEARAFLKCK
jgi:riboflavin kinase / FMN adenylyltransferase